MPNINKKNLNICINDRKTLPLYIENFSSSDSKLAKFDLNITSIIGERMLLNIPFEMPLSLDIVFTAEEPESTPTLYTFTFNVDKDCYIDVIAGTAKTLYSGTSGSIQIGREKNPDGSVNEINYQAFLPFYIDFSSLALSTTSACSLGVDSAKLIFTSASLSYAYPYEPLLLNIGADNKNGAYPSTAADLKNKVFQSKVVTSKTSEERNWEKDEEYSIDITSTIQTALGPAYVDSLGATRPYNLGEVIAWTTGSLPLLISNQAGMVITDDGSTTRKFYSSESGSPLKLEINLKRIESFNPITDTYIQSNYATTVFSKNSILTIGRNKTIYTARGLIKFNLMRLPSPSLVTVTSAKLYLYHESYITGNAAGTLNVHKMLKEPGYDDACWTYRYGTVAWSTAGAQSGVDFSATVSGSISVAAAESNGYKQITITDLATIQSWIDNSTTNYGFLLKSNEASGDKSVSAHTWGSSKNSNSDKRPYLVVGYTYNSRAYEATIKSNSVTIRQV